MADSLLTKTEKLLKYGKEQLSEKGVTSQATNIRGILNDIANVNGGGYDINQIIEGDECILEITDNQGGGKTQKQFYQDYINAGGKFGYSTFSELDLSGITSNANASQMFYNCSSLTNLNLSNFDTSKVTIMYNMFFNCKSLTSIDLSSFNTANVISMQTMFLSCSSLTSLDLSSFNTANVTVMSSMFSSCSNLTNLDVSNFDTSSVTNMSYMFDGCKSLTSLNLGNFDTSNVTNMGSMFSNCTSLTDISYTGTIADWQAKNITNSTTGIKEDGTVIVHCSDGDYIIGGSN